MTPDHERWAEALAIGRGQEEGDGMDLKTFVTETLTQIVAGVAEAQRQIVEMDVGAKVNPTILHGGVQTFGTDPTPVEFDVAVTVVEQENQADKSKTGGSVGILSVVGVKVGAEIGEEAMELRRNERVSRVQFKVMLSQPGDVKRAQSRPIPTVRTAAPY